MTRTVQRAAKGEASATPASMAAPARDVRLGAPDDAHEREADRIADAVVSRGAIAQRLGDGATRLRRQVEPEEEEVLQTAPEHLQRQPSEDEDEETLQLKAAPGAISRQGAAPAAAGAIASGGRPLGRVERAFFEPRFGRDLSQVRLHTGADAASAARDIGARAYTLRNHIGFAAGAYDPASTEGRRLIAHELTHVLQQGHAGVTLRREPDGSAQLASESVRREFAQDAADFLRGQAGFFLEQENRDLGSILDALRQTAQGGLRAIEGISADTEREAIRRQYRQAVDRLFTQRSTQAPDAVREAPTKPELYQEHRNRIMDFALPQHRAVAGSEELIAEMTADLPSDATPEQRARHRAIEDARANLQVHTGQVDFAIKDLFDTTGGRTTVNLPQDTAVRFAGNIPSGLQHGLRNVAATLNGILPGNRTIMLALDLSRFGGQYSSFRFTKLDLGSSLGTEILVEVVGNIGVEGLTEEQRAAMRARFDSFGFNRSGFSTSEFDEILIGLSRIPDADLNAVGALTFSRGQASAANPRAAAEYDEENHTIEVFDLAFGSGLVRAGDGDAPISLAAASIVHEVGHVLDLLTVHTARVALRQAEQDMLDAFGTGGRGYDIPARNDPRRAEYDEIQSRLRAARRAEGAARLRSGGRVRSGTITDAIPQGWQTPAFRAAARQDGANPASGAGFPTTYPSPASFWQEYFAEAYMLYRTSPDLLEHARPHVFSFMQNEFPDQLGSTTP